MAATSVGLLICVCSGAGCLRQKLPDDVGAKILAADSAESHCDSVVSGAVDVDFGVEETCCLRVVCRLHQRTATIPVVGAMSDIPDDQWRFGETMKTLTVVFMSVLSVSGVSRLAADDALDLSKIELPDLTEGDGGQVENVPSSEKYTLRYRFREGDVIRYETTRVGELRIAVGEQSKSDISRVKQIRRFDVTNVDASGAADLMMRFEYVEMSLQTDQGEPIVFRSDMEPAEIPRCFARVASKLTDAAPHFTVLPTGAPLNDAHELIRPEKEEQETRLMLPLPTEPVAIGEAWKYYNTVKVRLSEDVNRGIRLLTSCRLRSVKDGVARISFQTSSVSHVTTPAVKALLIEAFPKGDVMFDMESGRIVRRVIRNDNSVYGVHGPGSVLTTSAESIESLLPVEAVVSGHLP